jgi:mono/diheme cytochrome c family protein
VRFQAKRYCLLLLVPALACAQGLQETIAQGEKVFNQSCATGYCHGTKGAAGGAPRLVARGFDQAYINTTVTRGVPGTAMPAFGGNALSRSDPTIGGAPGGGRGGPPPPELSADAKRGRDLFSEAFRGFGRCSTCHEVEGIGTQIATPITSVPADPQALRNLVTPDVKTAVIEGESVPALIVSQGKRRTIVYDLTSSPPVLRSVDPSDAKIQDGSTWKHSSFVSSYNDSELTSILDYLRSVVHP